ncbi:hypothetical protein [Nocardioides sp.]|uniref:hypothetical protein n=1 Tax=Nocardioides sp. TaxID=35761 RepID=UPI00198CD474|nr:hypothetical protein [Nocardioides sp.]MBC7276237.1 hypothetical protein [Nocardioides sp.]
MPKRKKHQKRPASSNRFGDPRRRPFAEKVVDSPYWPAMFAVNEAEARGDVKGALEIIRRTSAQLDKEQFWHPSRVERLEQLSLLAALIPRWAHSRWILAQALQGTHPRNKWRMGKAINLALDVRGGPHPDRDREDDRIQILDRDWVYRQTFLYDLGGLEAFLRHDASGDLIAGADRIWEWARAQMRGLRLLGREPRHLHWEDPATGERLTTINIGAGLLVDDGTCVIGRIVPIDEGLMFEAAPLRVPEEVAYAVADEPERWIDALRDVSGRPDREPGEIWTHRGLRDYGLLTDIPYGLVDLAMDAGLHAFRHPDEELDDLDELFEHPTDYPACLAAWLVRPATVNALRGGAPLEGLAALGGFAEFVHEPAASLIRDLVDHHQEAA